MAFQPFPYPICIIAGRNSRLGRLNRGSTHGSVSRGIIIVERTHERQMRTDRLTKSSLDQLVSAIIPNRYYCYYLHSIASSTHVRRRCRSRCLFCSSLSLSRLVQLRRLTTLVSQSCLHHSISTPRAPVRRRHAVTIDACPPQSPACFSSAYFLARHE